MDLNITGKILLFKSLSMISDEVLSDFRKMPENLTFAQGVQMLKTAQEKLGKQSGHLGRVPSAKRVRTVFRVNERIESGSVSGSEEFFASRDFNVATSMLTSFLCVTFASATVWNWGVRRLSRSAFQ